MPARRLLGGMEASAAAISNSATGPLSVNKDRVMVTIIVNQSMVK